MTKLICRDNSSQDYFYSKIYPSPHPLFETNSLSYKCKMILLNSSVQTEKHKAEIAFLKRKAKDDAKRLKGHFEEEEDPLAIKDTNEN